MLFIFLSIKSDFLPLAVPLLPVCPHIPLPAEKTYSLPVHPHFKNNSTEDIIKHWGSIKNFDMFIQKIKDDEAKVAKLAIQQFGSIEKYTEAMKHNLEHFSELMETQLTEEVKEIGKHSDILYSRLTADLSEDVSSPKVQSIVHQQLFAGGRLYFLLATPLY